MNSVPLPASPKNYIARRIAAAADISIHQAYLVLNAIGPAIYDVVQVEQGFSLPGLGRFKTAPRAALKGVTPQGQAWSKPARTTIIFKAVEL